MNKDILSTTTRPFLLVFSFFLWIQNVQALPTVGTLTAAGGAFNFDLYNGDGPPLLVQSTNGGVSWAIVTIPNLPGSIFPDYGFFHTTSCNGSFCLAAGETDNDLTDGGVGTAIPLLVSTKNSGNTWEVVLDLPLQPNGTFEASSCAMNGINASTSTCVIVGYGTAGTGDFPADPPIPQLVISQNSGASWTVPTISGLPLSGDFHAVSCAKSGVCIAAGENDTNLTITPATQVTPLLVLSIDGGTTWETVTLNPSGPGIFNAASCSGDVVADTVCTVAGVSGTTTNPPTIPPTSPIPLLLTSINGGSSWNTITNIPNLPTLGSFSATSCTGSGIDAVCVAAGQNNSTSQPSPLLVESVGGSIWSKASVPQLSNNGYFTATSCTGSTSSTICAAVGRNSDGYAPQPLLVKRMTKVGNWVVSPSPIPWPFSGFYYATTCTGSGLSARCIAAGQIQYDDISGAPFLVTQTGSDAGKIAIIPNITKTGAFGGTGGTASTS